MSGTRRQIQTNIALLMSLTVILSGRPAPAYAGIMDMGDLTAQPRDIPTEPDKEKRHQQSCLAAGVYHEARGEGTDGMTGVANVVMNRVARTGLPPCAIVYEKRRGICQFSWVCTEFTLAVRDIHSWYESQRVAYRVMHRKSGDITAGATSFRSCPGGRDINLPGMNLTKVIGNQCFYR